MAENDFNIQPASFLRTNTSIDSHIFDLDLVRNASSVGVGCQLIADVTASKVGQATQTQLSNIVEVVAEPSSGDVLQVPSEFSTIQAAIDASSDGDIVQVADGRYHEAINFKRKKITVRGNTTSPTSCIIDGIKEDGSGPVEAPWSRPVDRPDLISLVTIDTREPGQCYDNDNPADDEFDDDTFTRANRVLEGFLIQNATAGTRYSATEPGCEPCSFNNGCECDEDCVGPDAPINCIEEECPGAGIDGFVGGGLWAFRSKFTVRNCLFVNNISDGGAGAFTRECDVMFSSCTFINNISRSNGGGLQLNHCVSIVDNCTFDSNLADGSAFDGIGHGGGLHHFSGQVAISNCIFSNNTCSGQGGGLDMVTREVLAFASKHGDSSIVDTFIINNNTTDSEDCGGLFISAREGDEEGVADAIVNISATSDKGTLICNNSNDSGDSNLCLGESLDGMVEIDDFSSICNGIAFLRSSYTEPTPRYPDGKKPCDPPTTEPQPPYTPVGTYRDWVADQMKCCKCLVNAEARGESKNCQECVAWTMHNRQHDDGMRYGSTGPMGPRAVPGDESTPCKQTRMPGTWEGGWPNARFKSCWCEGRDGGTPDDDIRDRIESICKGIGIHNYKKMKDPTGGANYFWTCGHEPDWIHCNVTAGRCVKVEGHCKGCGNCFYKCTQMPKPCDDL